MDIGKTTIKAEGVRFSMKEEDVEVGRASLFVLTNDLHDRPFGLLEDVYIDETQRGTGLGTRLVQQVIEVAKQYNCYKLIATSRYARPRVHDLYEKIGFFDYGKEFRLNL